MPSNTVNFNLPYPNTFDAPCDFDEQWCDFTDAVDGVLGTFREGIDRAIPVVPAALVRTQLTHNIVAGQPVPFNETVLDTAGMTNLDADPYHITITRPGRYTVAAYLDKNTSTVANSQFGMFMGVGTSGAWAILDRGVSLTYSLPGYVPVRSLAAGSQLALSFTTALVGLNTIGSAYLAAFWHSDNEAAT